MNASPATVSRAGIIFVSDTDLDWSPVVEGWILKRPVSEQPVFTELFARFVNYIFYDSKSTTFEQCPTLVHQSNRFQINCYGDVVAIFLVVDQQMDGRKRAYQPGSLY